MGIDWRVSFAERGDICCALIASHISQYCNGLQQQAP